MELNSWPGLIAVILSVISFYGTTYLVVALNTGWRFGYWLTGACFGALMVLLSIFWIVNPVGPQGALPKWVPVGAGAEVEQVTFEGESLSAPAQYPGGDWETAEEGDPQSDEFSSAITTCLSANLDDLAGDERKTCEDAQKLMPPEEEIPVLEGAAVAVTPRITEIRFAEDHGQLAGATVSPGTSDPRVAKNKEAFEPLAEPFEIVAIRDQGSLRVPAYFSLAIFTLFAAFHLWGLNRAERRKLNPAVV